MPQVNYNMSTLERCRCVVCPVQASSQCIAERTAGKPMPPHSLPDPIEVNSVYCSQAVGRSVCTDLNRSLTCMCPTCPVWQEYGLQSNYFCIKGAAS